MRSGRRDSGGSVFWQIVADAGLDLQFAADPSPDLLGFGGGGTGTLEAAAMGTTLRMDRRCQRYVFVARDATGNEVARSEIQLTARPPVARTSLDPTFPLPSDALFSLILIDPDDDEVSREVDLMSAASLEEVSQRLNLVPEIRAWVVQVEVGTAAFERLHVEAVQAGSGWRLRLGNPQLLFALGYDSAVVDPGSDRLEVAGGGDVRNADAVTRAEVETVLQRVEICATGPGGTPVVGGLIKVRADGDDVVLSSERGQVDVLADPPSLETALNVTTAATETRLAPGATAAFDSGVIQLQVDGQTQGVVFLFGGPATVRANLPLARCRVSGGSAVARPAEGARASLDRRRRDRRCAAAAGIRLDIRRRDRGSRRGCSWRLARHRGGRGDPG